MKIKISDNLLKKTVDNTPKLKLSKNLEIKREPLDMTETGFQRAGDLDTEKEKMTLEDIKDYVKHHTAKDKSNYNTCEGGATIVSFSQFVEMINDGYEIYKSEVLNENFISIEFQKEMKRNKSR